MARNKKISKSNYQFIDNALINSETYFDYLDRFKQIVLSMFEWVNLPSSMNAQYLERTLYYDGQATLLDTEKYGKINTRCSGREINIYQLPSKFRCYAYNLDEERLLYTGINKESNRLTDAILVQNNWDRLPTAGTMELFAMRLTEAERTADVNIKAQKTPVMILVDENQRVLMENLYSQFDGNRPYIFGDKNQLQADSIKALRTDAPFVANDIMTYKKQIWNEALTYLGINNINEEKKERLITDEANSNNELVNLNLQSRLAPRQEACKQFNELFGLTGTNKEISVRVRSDLYNIIKNAESIVSDYKEMEQIENIDSEVKENE